MFMERYLTLVKGTSDLVKGGVNYLGMTNSFISLAGSKRKSILRRKPYIYSFILTAAFLLLTGVSRAQLQTSGGISAFNLVQNTLLGGGVQLISVSFQCRIKRLGLSLVQKKTTDETKE